MKRGKVTRALALGASILLLGAFLRLFAVAGQPALSDEARAVHSAAHYMESGQFGPTMWYHPNLRNIVLYWVGQAAGYGPYALRGMSLATGILSIPLAGILLYLLTRNRSASLLAAFLLAVEQVHITFSRQAIQETWTTFFFLLGTVLAVLSAQREKPGLLVLSGLVFGLGVSSKFHAVVPLLICLGAGLSLSWKERSPAKAAFVIACLAILPATVYVLTYIPWFGRGYGVLDWVRMQSVLLVKMATHAGNPMDQVIDTRAWQWFLRPMGYANFVFFEGKPFVTIAFSNPFVWSLVVPSTAFLIWSWLPRMNARGGLHRGSSPSDTRNGALFVVLLFLATYLPLALSPRPIWLLSSLATLPFALMIVALAAVQAANAVTWGRRALAGYTVVVLVSSLALYPMALGEAKSHAYLEGITERFRPPFERGGTINP